MRLSNTSQQCSIRNCVITYDTLRYNVRVLPTPAHDSMAAWLHEYYQNTIQVVIGIVLMLALVLSLMPYWCWYWPWCFSKHNTHSFHSINTALTLSKHAWLSMLISLHSILFTHWMKTKQSLLVVPCNAMKCNGSCITPMELSEVYFW